MPEDPAAGVEHEGPRLAVMLLLNARGPMGR